ncbi:MAG TPA: aldose 1-epimerase [Solirubrobacteraceae bacterium]|jgi:galactose mutarotase-like enzyme|nr:aldose 1-epimerase [Solirubrobacteraceae bacterium]
MHRVQTLRSGPLEAGFIPSLGMVCSSLRFEREQLLELRGGPEAYAERGSTFGIPLLHPWANRLAGWSYEIAGRHVELDPASPCVHRDRDTGLPIHGLLAASRFWTVTAQTGSTLDAALDFGAHPELLAAFPFPHRLELSVALEPARLAICLAVIPTGDVAVPISFGFHPYLRLPGSERRSWTVELPVRQRLVLDERGIPTRATEELAVGALGGPLGDRAFDDCFDRLEPGTGGRPPAFAVADDRLRLAVEFVSCFSVGQVYAPAGSEFICFEPMTAPVNALRSGSELQFASPGGKLCAAFAVTVTEINLLSSAA